MNSEELFARALRVIPGGVNSPARAFHGVGGAPVFFAEGAGAWLTDAEGRRYADYVCSWGAIIVGHAREEVVDAVRRAAAKGLGFGAPTETECRFAETLRDAMPSLQTVRAVNSGTEATMSAIRVARGFCGRDLLVKFDGCYHGHADSLLVAAGSGALTLGVPSSDGVPDAVAAGTISLPYNDSQAAADIFARRGGEIAAVIVEPVAGNMNMARGTEEFLRALRALCDKHGAVLIFDEVMSGFRVSRGGAQEIFNIAPDLTCLGKVVGGGLGVAAFGGRRDIMQTLAPEGGVYQAGTLSGNPVALAAGLATLEIVLADGFFAKLRTTADALTTALATAAQKHGAPFCADFLGGMLGLYFRETPPTNLAEARSCDIGLFRKFFHAMLSRGVYLAPSAYEAGFITSAHGAAEIAHTAAAAEESFAEIMH
ncbi:MAG: glutamate-1-semialdehyde 2,1-aminomutase [Gammaproteobacteria bacterium]